MRRRPTVSTLMAVTVRALAAALSQTAGTLPSTRVKLKP
jgi:hypothetical protein